VHFLHIPKTGGTALGTALSQAPQTFPIVLHGHFARLADVPIGEGVVFAVRDPITRFVSGFNSRLRQGLPRHKIEWSAAEKAGFARFPTANSLAEALSDVDLQKREFAIRLVREIFHLGVPLSYWLSSCEYLRSRAGDIVWIILQRNLADDFKQIKAILDLPRDLQLPDDLIGSHRTPGEFDATLSAAAEENLTSWYVGDFPLFNCALELRDSIMAGRK
jgi:hypothetical protein